MNILITGATGFLGSNLFKFYQEKENIKLLGLSRNTQDHNDIIDCDIILQKDKSDKIIQDFSPDVVFHLAGTFEAKSLEYLLGMNTIGTENVLKSCANLNKKVKFIFSSSSAVYGKPEKNPITENFPIQPLNYYGISKRASELLIKQFCAFNESVQGVSARIFNIYGQNMSTRLLPGKIFKFISTNSQEDENGILEIGNTSSCRDFVHVLDVCKALYQLATHSCNYEVYNIGTGIPTQIKTFLDSIQEQSSFFNYKQTAMNFKTVDVPMVTADITRIQSEFEWQAEIDLKTGITRTFSDNSISKFATHI